MRLGVLQNERVVYIDVVPGSRRITIANRPGDAQPLTSTSTGKALMLDASESNWQTRPAADLDAGQPGVGFTQLLPAPDSYQRCGASALAA